MQKRVAYTTNRLMQARASSTRKRRNGSGEFWCYFPVIKFSFVDFLLFLVQTLRIYCTAGEFEDIRPLFYSLRN